MGYIARAFVKISRESAQNLILEFCRLDYKNSAYHPCDMFWFIEDGYFYSREYTTELEEGVFVDCNAHTPNGTEEEAVRLFLILAEMRDDTNDSKWLVWSDAPYDDIKIIRRNICYKGVAYCDEDEEWQTYSYELYRDATPLEVAQAFKEGRI